MATCIPVNELERLFAKAASDPAARPTFYRAMLEHELFVISEGSGPKREKRTDSAAARTLQLRVIEFDGRPHIPIFTSIDRISAAVGTEAGFVAMKGRDLLNVLRGKDLVMNPGSDYGKVFSSQEVSDIIDGSILGPPATLDVDGKEILLGQPKEYPHHITGALRRFFATQGKVKRAYLAHAFISGIDKVPHTLIGVEVVDGWQHVIEGAGVVVREVARPGEVVDFVQVRSGASDTLVSYMCRETKPFYKRKLFGLF